MNKIFGIGLNKTGTNSLNKALKILGVNSVHYPHDYTTYKEIREANYNLSVLKFNDAITDLPSAIYYKEYDETFKNSKFILTVRDKEKWIKSVKNQWEKNKNLFNEDLPPVNGDYKKIALFFVTALYKCHSFNEKVFLNTYETHNENVKKHFENKANLLVIDICNGDGWEKLCPFLNIKPPKETPFPQENIGIY